MLPMVSDPNDLKANTETEARSTRVKQLIEVCVFLVLIVLISAVFSFFIIKQEGLKFVPVAVSVILSDLALVGLVLFFLWRGGESLSSIGWTFNNIREEVILGAGLFLPLFFGSGLLRGILQAAGLTAPPIPLPSFLIPRGILEAALAILLIVVVAISEEIIFRGYLIQRFKTITSSLTTAVLLSCVIFSLGHGYEGSAGAVTTGFIGLALAIVYIWRQSLVAPIVMHFLQNFVGIFLLVLLKTE